MTPFVGHAGSWRVPSALRLGPFRFFFYAADNREPPHVHAARDSKRAKVWLQPTEIAWSKGFTRHELRLILRAVRDHNDLLHREWDEYFRD